MKMTESMKSEVVRLYFEENREVWRAPEDAHLAKK